MTKEVSALYTIFPTLLLQRSLGYFDPSGILDPASKSVPRQSKRFVQGELVANDGAGIRKQLVGQGAKMTEGRGHRDHADALFSKTGRCAKHTAGINHQSYPTDASLTKYCCTVEGVLICR